MAIVCARGSFVPLTLPLEDDGHASISNDLLSLRLNLWIGVMYVEQEMYTMAGDISKTKLMQKNKNENVHVWILGPETFRVMGTFDSHTNSYCHYNERVCHIDCSNLKSGHY